MSRRFIQTRPVIMAAMVAVTALPSKAAAEDALFESRRLTPPAEFTASIEGPAVDVAGALYVANFRRRGDIGKVAAGATRAAPFTNLPEGSIPNGIRFDRDGRMYVADFKGNTVFVIERGQSAPHPYVKARFTQPNDLAIAADGTLYASDPDFGGKTGRIWRITRGADGRGRAEVMTSERERFGVTNGIDLSPDDKTLFVSESRTREVWAYRIDGSRLADPRLMHRFDGPPDSELDGLRTDRAGNIYVTRPGAGKVSVIAPDETVPREIRTLGKTPSNLTFGGADGKTVFVTQVDGRLVETFRVDRAGREPCLQAGGSTC